jgi:hypothetical protein
MKTIDFEPITLRLEANQRGGGIEISLDTLGHQGHKMTAYQNYLGGGMLGRVANDCTLEDWREDDKLVEIGEQLKKYFFDITNPDSEWEHQTYDQNQKMSISAY